MLLYENLFSDVVRTRVYNLTTHDARNIISESCVCHNFSPFTGADGNLYAIGGQDSWKNDVEWYGIQDVEGFYEYYERRFGEAYKKGPKDANKVLNKIYMLRTPMKHSKGLYLFKSEDGFDWAPHQRQPIITLPHNGFNSALDWKSSEFDGMLWCQFHDGLYYLFCRENVGQGERFIQYATSVDMIRWSKFQRINIPYEVGVNSYYMVGGKYKNEYIAMIPQYDDDNAWIKIYRTNDLINFTYAKTIQETGVSIIDGKPKNPTHPVNGMIYGIYGLHHNYMGNNIEADVEVKNYEI